MVNNTTLILNAQQEDILDGVHNWPITFFEDFNDPVLDNTKWKVGQHTANFNVDGVNDPSTISIDNSVLKIEARNQPGSSSLGKTGDYVSSEISTWRRFRQRYGYFSARIRHTARPHSWPAFWMMPDRGDYGNPAKHHMADVTYDISGFTHPVASAVLKFTVDDAQNFGAGGQHFAVYEPNNPVYMASVWRDSATPFAQGEVVTVDVTAYVNEQLSAASSTVNFHIKDEYRRSLKITFGKIDLEVDTVTVPSDKDGQQLFVQEDFVSGVADITGGAQEIDVIEILGEWDGLQGHSAAHWGGYGAGGESWNQRSHFTPVDSTEDWHIYSVLWEPGRLRFFVDHEYIPGADLAVSDVSDIHGYMILSHQVGTWNPGTPAIDPDDFPVEMEVDFVEARAML